MTNTKKEIENNSQQTKRRTDDSTSSINSVSLVENTSFGGRGAHSPADIYGERKMKCDCCLKEIKKKYVVSLCKECADKIDEHIEEEKEK